MLKKLVVLLSLMAISASAVYATNVVLVSDNYADQASALEIANVLNATIVTTPWGIYNESIVNEIKTLNPDKIIIVGGNLAVVDNYSTALENDGYTVERIGGKTRYDTNANVTLRFQNEFAKVYGNATLCVANGTDIISLNETMAKVRDGHCLVVLSNGTNLSVEPEKLHLRIKNVEIMENPMIRGNNSIIANRLMHSGYNVSINTIPEYRIKEMIQNRIKSMEMKIEMLDRQGVNTTHLKEQLAEITNLLNQNKYQNAYELMIKLENEQMVMIKTHLHHDMMRGNVMNNSGRMNNMNNMNNMAINGNGTAIMNHTMNHVANHTMNHTMNCSPSMNAQNCSGMENSMRHQNVSNRQWQMSQ